MTKRLTSLRLSKHTQSQVNELTGQLGMTMTEVIAMAIDRIYFQEVVMQHQIPTNTDYPEWIRSDSTLRRLWRDSLQWRVEIDRAKNNPAMQNRIRQQAAELNEAVSLID
jgi:antitoxin component of RelBE/YafQ-DinJ toxin-antitoxin module